MPPARTVQAFHSRTPPQITALVADADSLARNALRTALGKAGVAVVAQAGDAAQAIHLAGRCRPEVILMDARLPCAAEGSALAQIVAGCPDVPVVLLAASGDDDAGIQALTLGAAGYLSRDTDPGSVARAVKRVVSGQAAISRAMATRLVARLRERAGRNVGMRPVKSVLTTREWEVLDLMTAGRTTSEIAQGLVLSVDTVHSHVHHILKKLSAHTRAEAVEIARHARDGAYHPV